jgi:Skp family chaperone for outer membrane proteins
MKKLSIFIAIIFLTSSANATTIAVLNLEQIVKESKAVQDVQSKVSKKQEEFQKEITKKQSDLESEQKRLEAKKSILSDEAFKKEQKDFDKKIDLLKSLVEKRQESLKKASADGLAKVNDLMKDIIVSVSKEKGFDIILPASQIVFSADNLDVSSEVLTRLNKKVTKVDVKF